MGHHFGLLRPSYLAQLGTNLTFDLLKAHVFYGLEIFTPVNALLLLRAQIMFRPVKVPLWAGSPPHFSPWGPPGVGERSNFKIFLRTRKIMVMHSNEGRV